MRVNQPSANTFRPARLVSIALAASVLFSIFVLARAAVSELAVSESRQPRTFGQRAVELKPCEIQGVEGKMKCGTYEVYENRATKQGRKISLKIVVFPATGPKPETDPFVYIPGGPGSSATEDAPYLAKPFAKIRERRDLLFVDQRGTGGSNPLNCDLFDPAEPQSYLGYFFPLEAVRKCRGQLESRADLTLYTTPIAMDDLDEVRAALGYQRLNLYGASYGTRSALVYLKRHAAHVRTATLFGVSPTNQFMPRAFPQDTERALQGVLSECAGDEACSKAFPNLPTETKAVLERLLKGPVEVEVNANIGSGDDTAAGNTTTPKRKVARWNRAGGTIFQVRTHIRTQVDAGFFTARGRSSGVRRPSLTRCTRA